MADGLVLLLIEVCTAHSYPSGVTTIALRFSGVEPVFFTVTENELADSDALVMVTFAV